MATIPLNDSSYDSLENELNDDSGSPLQDLLGRKDKQENRSHDSVITLSDCDLDQPDPDQDPDPATVPVHLQLPPLVHPRRFAQSVHHQPHPLPERDVLPGQGSRWLRRRSEPAIRHPPSSLAPNLGQHSPAVRKTSYDGVMGRGDRGGEVFGERLGDSRRDRPAGPGDGGGEIKRDKRNSRDVPRRKHKLPAPLRLDVSCSSLSSPATSPSGSSMSSLDSAFSQCSTDCTPADPPGTPRALGSSSPKSPAPNSPGSPIATCPLSHGTAPSSSTAPKEPCEWSQHKIAHGLHPNTWLKRDRRLSLRQQDMTGWEEEEPWELGVAPSNKPLPSNGPLPSSDRKAHGLGEPSRKRANSPPSYQQAILQMQEPGSPVCKAADRVLTVKELRQLHDQLAARSAGSDIIQRNTSAVRGGLPQSVFFGQGSSSVTLHRQNSHSLIPATGGSSRTSNAGRRASEPAVDRCALRRISTPDLERLHREALAPAGKASAGSSPQDCGLQGSGVEPLQSSAGPGSEPQFCQAVRDYFSQTQADPDSCSRRSQEVAAAILQSKREWQSRRCSDPRFEDFDQMVFAEESYV